jgi:hypothetical protein
VDVHIAVSRSTRVRLLGDLHRNTLAMRMSEMDAMNSMHAYIWKVETDEKGDTMHGVSPACSECLKTVAFCSTLQLRLHGSYCLTES